ncbi:single-stranded DNA-binding protein [Macrococcus carouselicus]|uniref:Single-stranded DNA-binding protein n=1 Tax=Macrococcus carouselicus TaxID=69969 RepID=A0A9Q8FPZ0_9STAP|nr:single-stranded DNA-binding protein [Macrococcus carouselicus]TDL95387.1 single-stranded DNA-binding protein [Macrococcus carouselicus]
MINKVVLVGRLANVPKTNHSLNKNSVQCVTFPLAIERGYKPRDENAQTVDFLHCKAFNKTAANILQYCRKGSTVCVTGQIHSNRYQKPGEDKPQYFTEIIIESIKFLPNFGAIKTGDVLPQTPDEIWNELSDAEKTHAIMLTKETLVKQMIAEQNTAPIVTEPVKVIADDESHQLLQTLDEISTRDSSDEVSEEAAVVS